MTTALHRLRLVWLLLAGLLCATTGSFAAMEGYDGTGSGFLAAKTGAAPAGNIYSTAFEMKLAPSSYPGLSRGAHFQEANGALLRAMEADAGMASSMQQLGVNLSRTPTGLAPRTSPAGWTWHHAPEPGVMQLVPRPQHAPGSIFQPTLHPVASAASQYGVNDMTLLNAVTALNELDDEATIYAKEPWRPDSASLVACEPDEGSLPPEAKDSGLVYFLEVAIAREFLEDWQASLATNIPIKEQCDRLIQYALNDA